MATFPDYVKILVKNYGEEIDYGALRSEMDGGIAKQRPTRTKGTVTRDATLCVFSLADKQRFDEWIDTDSGRGLGWFDWTDPLTRTVKRARIVAGRYKWGEPNGPIWEAPCQIETLGR